MSHLGNGRRTTIRISLVRRSIHGVVVVGLAFLGVSCTSSDGPDLPLPSGQTSDTDASSLPTGVASSPTSPTSPTTTADSEVVPADGPVLQVTGLTLNAPRRWRPTSGNDDANASAGSIQIPGGRVQLFSLDSAGASETTANVTDDLVETLQGRGDAQPADPVTFGGVEAGHATIAREKETGTSVDTYGVIRNGSFTSFEIVLPLSLPATQRRTITESILATVRFD